MTFSNSQYYPELYSTLGHVLHLQVQVWERFFVRGKSQSEFCQANRIDAVLVKPS